MPLQCEVLPYRPEAREKLLCAFRVTKAAHATLAFTRGLMTVFRTVVQSGGSFDEHVLHVRKLRDLAFCRRIAAQLIRDDLARHRARTIGEIDLHISGCINSCGHHHSGHIGILGVDKDGKEWYQVTLGGSDGSATSGAAQPGKVIGPSFSAPEVPDVIEAVLSTYLGIRRDVGARQERFIETVRRVGLDPFKAAANEVRTNGERAA
jgi:NAD(P)H-nitrite reductase large subunit